MRTFEELKADVESAIVSDNAPLLLRLAVELEEHATPEALAAANRARGWACYCTGDNRAALEHFLRALALYPELGNRIDVARVTANIGSVYLSTGDYDASLEHYNRALALYHELGNRKGMAYITGNIGIGYRNRGDFPAAFEHFNRALALYYELGHRSGMTNVTSNIGNVYLTTGDYPAALEHYNKALALYHERGDRSGVAHVTGNIGIVYEKTGDYPAALEYFNSALALHHELGERNGVARATGNIGNVYAATGDYPAALEHLNRVLALFHELGDRGNVASAMSNILLSHLGNHDIVSAQKTLVPLDELLIEDPHTVVSRESGRAAIYVHQENSAAAQLTLANALAIASTHGLRKEQADVRKELRDLAQKCNDFPAYIEHNNEFTRITEEINGKQTTLQLAMQAKERELAAKDKEVAKHMAVLHSTLPKHIADRVARGETVNDKHECVAVVFLDLVGFTTMSSSMDAIDVVAMLERVFGICDATMNTHGLMKIKTIGDSYMAVAFDNIHNAAQAAVELANAITEVPVRIGIHCGPVVAGVLGKERMQYDVWGDTVNIASRMESTSEAGRIHISEAFANVLSSVTSTAGVATSEANVAYAVSHRGETEIKGKGPMNTYWLEGA
ncbi:hypothetical protein BH10BAC6_BH10BAC6_17590 [soil metagenome]